MKYNEKWYQRSWVRFLLGIFILLLLVVVFVEGHDEELAQYPIMGIVFLILIYVLDSTHFSKIMFMGVGFEKARQSISDVMFIICPLVARIYISGQAKDLLPQSGIQYVYDLMHHVLDNPLYSNSEKETYIKELKFALLNYIINKFTCKSEHSNPFIKNIENNFYTKNGMNEKPISDALNTLWNQVKAYDDKFSTESFLTSFRRLKCNTEIAKVLDANEIEEFKKNVDLYYSLTAKLYDQNIMDKEFLRTGKIDHLKE